jgi:hypothetical protein
MELFLFFDVWVAPSPPEVLCNILFFAGNDAIAIRCNWQKLAKYDTFETTYKNNLQESPRTLVII